MTLSAIALVGNPNVGQSVLFHQLTGAMHGQFALSSQLSPIQAVVGMVTITLFVPRIARMMMIVKE